MHNAISSIFPSTPGKSAGERWGGVGFGVGVGVSRHQNAQTDLENVLAL